MSARVRALLEAAVTDGVCPAAALVACRGGGAPLRIFAGAAKPALRFDLASLTKPLVTTTAAMLLVADGKLDLESPVATALPEWRSGAAERVSFAQLLLHEAGLVWWRPFYEELDSSSGPERREADRSRLREAVASLELEASPGARAVYSDPGFILLEWALERLASRPLGTLVSERVFEPWKMRSTGFVDLKKPGALAAARERHSFAPTQLCPWRGRRLVAEVHDHNAHAMGGVAGHAGLFATADDVLAFGRGVLQAWQGRTGPLCPEVVGGFFARRGGAQGSTRCLGWDTPSPQGSSAGHRVSPAAVGHLGFTGTSLWIDPEQESVVVLLTNRVYDGVEDDRIRTLRPQIHDATHALLSGEA